MNLIRSEGWKVVVFQFGFNAMKPFVAAALSCWKNDGKKNINLGNSKHSNVYKI